MAIRETITGKAFSKKTHQSASGPQSQQELCLAYCEYLKGCDFELDSALERLQAGYSKAISRHGLPCTPGPWVKVPGKPWAPFRGNIHPLPGTCVTANIAGVVKKEGFSHPDIEWWAAKGLDYIFEVRAELEKGDAKKACFAALMLGNHVKEAVLFFGWADHAERGVTVVKAAKVGHEKTHGSAAEKAYRREVVCADLDAEIARGTKLTAAYEIVGERHGISGRTVRSYAKKS